MGIAVKLHTPLSISLGTSLGWLRGVGVTTNMDYPVSTVVGRDVLGLSIFFLRSFMCI